MALNYFGRRVVIGFGTYVSFISIGIIRAYCIPAAFGDIGNHLKGCRVDSRQYKKKTILHTVLSVKATDEYNAHEFQILILIQTAFIGQKQETYYDTRS